MTRWAVVPAKDFARAKSRLDPVLEPGARGELAREMLLGVLDALQSSELFEGVLVATDGDDVGRLARARGAETLADPAGPPLRLGLLVDRALDRLRARGVTAAVVMMSDLPRVGGADVRQLALALAEHDLGLAPDHARTGTNALALSLDALPCTDLGYHDSFARHLARARRLGLRAAVIERPGLANDVDLPADLQRLSLGAALARPPSRALRDAG